jgi:hypothetical protein
MNVWSHYSDPSEEPIYALRGDDASTYCLRCGDQMATNEDDEAAGLRIAKVDRDACGRLIAVCPGCATPSAL